MKKQIHPDKLFEHIRQLPVELPFEQIEQLVLAQPIVATATTGLNWKLWFNLKNNILMTGFMIGIGLITSLFFATDPPSEMKTTTQQQVTHVDEETIPSSKSLDKTYSTLDFLQTQALNEKTPSHTVIPFLDKKKDNMEEKKGINEKTAVTVNQALLEVETTDSRSVGNDFNVPTSLSVEKTQKHSPSKETITSSQTTTTKKELEVSINKPIASAKKQTITPTNDPNRQKVKEAGDETEAETETETETETLIEPKETNHSATTSELPKGWYTSGCSSKHFKVGMDTQESKTGSKSAFIEALPNEKGGYYSENLEQKIDATPYLGKRIRLTGFIKTNLEGQNSHATMKMRTINKKGHKVLTYDYMTYRRIRGNTEWQAYEIVLDVPKRASTIIYGAGMRGKGKIWMDNFKISVVDKDTPTTHNRLRQQSRNPLDQPTNTNFEEGN